MDCSSAPDSLMDFVGDFRDLKVVSAHAFLHDLPCDVYHMSVTRVFACKLDQLKSHADLAFHAMGSVDGYVGSRNILGEFRGNLGEGTTCKVL